MRIMVIVGCRPEAIKMAPVIKLLGNEAIVVSTGQHKEMLKQALEIFDITPDISLDVMEPNQKLDTTSAKIINELHGVIETHKPSYILVQGDTTTAFCGALAGFYNQIPVGHIEAGLRTYDTDPYPEESHRRMISMIASDHFAPTQYAANNLKNDNVLGDIIVTGNTVVDALLMMKKEVIREEAYCLVTCHRRENFKYLDEICDNISALSGVIKIVMPVHPNPNVHDKVHRLLGSNHNIELLEPLDYQTMVNLMYGAKLIVTDSGGIQEEAAALHRPTLVMRESTERQEGIESGIAILGGTNFYNIACEVLSNKAIYNKMVESINPYGEGNASSIIVSYILKGA